MNRRCNTIFRYTNRIISVFILIFVAVNLFNIVNADIITDASDWFEQGPANSSAIVNLSGNAFSEIVKLVNQIGTAVIAVVTVILGIKYLLGTATGKGEVKEQMISLLVACLLFFGWSNLSSLFIKNATYNPATGTYENVSSVTQLFIFENTTSVSAMAAKVFALVVLIGKVVAIVVTMYLGAKYILSGASGKAELKQKGPMFIIGILLIFSTLNILSFLSDTILQATTVI